MSRPHNRPLLVLLLSMVRFSDRTHFRTVVNIGDCVGPLTCLAYLSFAPLGSDEFVRKHRFPGGVPTTLGFLELNVLVSLCELVRRDSVAGVIT